ncbi:hypothetical protein ABZP36_006839 [Zizania latifolia]
MDRNLSGFLIGCAGVAVTLLAYEQAVVSSTQGVAAGFVLLFALFVKEGFISSSPSDFCASAAWVWAPLFCSSF